MADRPVIASPGRGASIALPSLADPAPPPMMGLGAAAAPPMPGFDLMGSFNAPAGRPLSLGAAIPIAQKAPRERRAQATGGLGAAAAPAPMAPVETPPPSALQSAMGDTAGRIGEYQDYLASNPITYTSRANPERPIVERKAREFFGGDYAGPLQLEPFVPPPIEPGESEVEYMQRVQQLQEEDEQRQFQESETLGDVRMIGAPGHLGMAEAQLQAVEGQGAAEIEQQKQVAQVQKEAAEMSRAATAEARAADLERRDFARQQRDAITIAQQVQQQARTKLQALPELDPNRAFKSMDGGAKFWAILGSLAGGMIGSTQVNDRLFQIAQNGLEAQKANAAQTFDQAAAADASVGQQMGLYRELLGAAGDEATADAMFISLQLEDAAQMLEAQLAETTVPVMQAELKQSLVNLRQQISDQQSKVELALATTPERIVSAHDPIGARNRRRIEKQIDKERDFERDLTKMGIEGEEKGLERDLKREIEGAKAGKKMGAKTAEQAYVFGKDVEKIDTAIAGIDALLNKDDIEGYGFTASPIPGTFSSGKSDTNAQIDLVLDELARLKSGAAIGEDEWEMYDGMLRGGTTLGGEDRLRRNLQRVKTFLNNKRKGIERGLDRSARDYYNRNAEAADFEARWTGGGDEPVVEED